MAPFDAQLVDEIALDTIGSPAELFLVPAVGGQAARLIWIESMGIFKSKIFLTMTRGAQAKGIKRLTGEMMRRLHVPSAYLFRHLRNEDFNLFCMTLSDNAGKILWQYGRRSETPAYCSHMGQNLLQIADINGDGKAEIVALHGPRQLGIFDVNTGKLIADSTLPSDNFTTVRVAKTGADAQDWTILVANSDAGYPPHAYSNPAILLDNKLNVLKEYELSGGAGHYPQVFDADGDGLDEFLIGYTLVDHDGRTIWVAEGFDDPSVVDAYRMHADHVLILESNGTGKWFAAIAGTDKLYLFDSKGRRLWQRPGDHPQYLFYGRLHPTNAEPHLFLLNCRVSMELIDIRGNGVWKGYLPANWPLGRPGAVRGDNLFHMGVPGSLWQNPDEGGKDFIVYNEGGYPYGIDGMGNVIVEFPCPSNAKQPDYDIPRCHRPDDYGYGYRSMVADIDGDGQQEVLIYDRRFVWVYKVLL